MPAVQSIRQKTPTDDPLTRLQSLRCLRQKDRALSMWQTHIHKHTCGANTHLSSQSGQESSCGDRLRLLGIGHVSRSLPKVCLLKIPFSLIQKAWAPSPSFLHSFNKHALCQARCIKNTEEVLLTLKTVLLRAPPFSNWLVSCPSTPQALWTPSAPILSLLSLTTPTNPGKEGWVRCSLGTPFGPAQIKGRNLWRQGDTEEKT